MIPSNIQTILAEMRQVDILLNMIVHQCVSVPIKNRGREWHEKIEASLYLLADLYRQKTDALIAALEEARK
ncbi:MAG: hypothetical protein FWE91_06540 [Defluviitaleaceae bacterium]|nr:hypothetical protein [Defluviitaleaceae bacterium]